jgi:geranylgeranyl pyrophosphate synthase
MTFEELLDQKIDILPASRTREAMRYSLLAGGKRIRPRLLYETVRGYGRDEHLADDPACALEMIHTYSLIHDDLPAMDNDDLRRGRPTCHKQFDEATAILAGDGLLTYAFQVISGSDLPAETVQKCISILSTQAGAGGMVLGQCLDIEEGEHQVDWEDLKQIHHYKTGCLLAAPLMMGAVIAGQDEETIQIWEQIGYTIGLAFQVQDDILDVELTAEEFGKSNSDERNDKVTSVTLLGIEEAEQLMHRLYDEAGEKIRMMKGFDGTAMLDLLAKIENRRK